MKSNAGLRYGIVFVCVCGFVLLSPAMAQEDASKTKAQVDELIKTAGSTHPEWWESVELDYPETLDLSWPVRQGGAPGGRGRGGQPTANAAPTHVDDYLTRVVYTDPSKHKPGIKLINHLMTQHADDPEKLKRSLNTLGNMYYELLGDHTRAAFCWQKCAKMDGSVDTMKMAHCYAELGSQAAAQEMLSQIDKNAARNNKELIKMWAKVGGLDKALEMVDSFPESGRGGMRQNDKYLFSGDLCRAAGQYDKAIEFYQKILSAPNAGAPARGGRGGLNVEARATNNLAAVKLIKQVDVSKVPDGAYTAEAQSYGGQLTVKVECKGGKIVSCEIVRNTDTPRYFVRAQSTKDEVVKNQGFAGIVAVTGATISSDAIINAAAQALSEAIE